MEASLEKQQYNKFRELIAFVTYSLTVIWILAINNFIGSIWKAALISLIVTLPLNKFLMKESNVLKVKNFIERIGWNIRVINIAYSLIFILVIYLLAK